MRILVTGGCGFIGTNLIRDLVANSDHHVTNIDKLTYAANPISLADVSGSDRYQFLQGDISDAKFIADAFAVADPDAVMHLAAESHVDRSIDGPGQFIQTNIVGTFQLLDAARRHFDALTTNRQSGFRFLHVSTDEVYGSLAHTGRFCESTAYDPHSPYSASKASSDHLARAWHCTYKLPVIVTNCSNNYGPYQFPEKLLPLMIIKCIGDETLPVYGEGKNVRDWLHVADHVAALRTVLEHGIPGETYNIGGDDEWQNIDLVREVCQIMDSLGPSPSGQSHATRIQFVSDRPGHDFRYAIDSSKLQRELGWLPTRTIQSGLRETVQWYLENKTWWQSILNNTYQLQRLGGDSRGADL